eukprot:8528524-Karenia_brevis.AAC.1
MLAQAILAQDWLKFGMRGCSATERCATISAVTPFSPSPLSCLPAPRCSGVALVLTAGCNV